MVNKRNFLKIALFTIPTYILLFSTTFIPSIIFKNKNFIRKKFSKKKYSIIWLLKNNDS